MKSAPKSLVRLCFALVMTAHFPNLYADTDIRFIPFVEAGYDHYDLELEGDIPLPTGGFVRGDAEYIFDVPTLRGGLSASLKKFSGNIYFRTSGKGNDTQDNLGDFPSVKYTGDRGEWGISGGYRLNDSVGVFLGYRDSETKASGSVSSEYKFVNDGYFLGTDYTLALTENGGLTFSLGYAWLDSELDYRLADLQLPAITGNGDGFKVSAVWRDLWNTNWGYSVGVEYFNYEFDLDQEGDPAEKITAQMTETETTFGVGLFYIF